MRPGKEDPTKKMLFYTIPNVLPYFFLRIFKGGNYLRKYSIQISCSRKTSLPPSSLFCSFKYCLLLNISIITRPFPYFPSLKFGHSEKNTNLEIDVTQ